MNILILGPQGAGKGTQAKRISEEYELPHIATGDLYRAAIANGTDIGRQVEPLLRAGTLVPDDVTVQLVRNELTKSDRGFVLDGFPRTLPQAEALDELLEELDRPLSIVLLLALDDEIARERLLKRAHVEGRADDNPEAIDARLATYHRLTAPVVDHYRATGKLVQLHAERSMEEVWREISDSLGQVEARA